MNPDLFTPIALGDLELPNRMVMAPMTRSRAGAGDVITELTATYYAQRATAGLIVSEATQVSAQGKGYAGTPGIFTEAHVDGWRKVTDAVHAAGGRMFLQLWHVGRISIPSVQIDGALPVAPSAIKAAANQYTGEAYPTPRALELSEMPGIVKQFADGARNAKLAGFEGVEIHGANGYLLDQFLRDGTNQRTDEYGGSVENRARLLLEVTEAVIAVWGRGRVGVRVSPTGAFNDMADSDPASTFTYAAQKLSDLGIAYLHIIEPIGTPNAVAPMLRQAFEGNVMMNSGFTKETANAAISSGDADLISFGVPFLTNPDLVRRFAEDAPLNAPDQATFYGGDAHGYTDYPALA